MFMFYDPSDLTPVRVEYERRKEVMGAKMMAAPLSYLKALEIYLDERDDVDEAQRLEILVKLQKEMTKDRIFSEQLTDKEL